MTRRRRSRPDADLRVDGVDAARSNAPVGLHGGGGARPAGERGDPGLVLAPEERVASLRAARAGELVYRQESTSAGATAVHWKAKSGATVVEDAAGTPIGFVGVVSDVTTQVQAEVSLAESEAKYRNLVELRAGRDPDRPGRGDRLREPGGRRPRRGRRAGGSASAGRSSRSSTPRTRERVEGNVELDLRGEESPPTAVDILRPDGTTVAGAGARGHDPVRRASRGPGRPARRHRGAAGRGGAETRDATSNVPACSSTAAAQVVVARPRGAHQSGSTRQIANASRGERVRRGPRRTPFCGPVHPARGAGRGSRSPDCSRTGGPQRA